MANLTASPACSPAGVGSVDLVYTGPETPASFKYQLFLGGVLAKEATAAGVSVTINEVANGTYTAKVLGNADAEIGSAIDIVVSCLPPPPGPAPEIPGTCTPPAAKYMAVGGTVPNPIIYTFAFQVNNVLAVAKIGHHVEVKIYKGNEVTASATTRARVRNGAAHVDVSTFVRALMDITPPAGTGIVQAAAGALVRYHIGFVEKWNGVTMGEITVADKFAVNAALQSQVNDFITHVIKPS